MNAAAQRYTVDDEERHRAATRVSAVCRLGFMRQEHPQLRRAEAAARLDLAAAIIAMDVAEDRIEAGEEIHNINEQLAVERAAHTYAQALADLVRGATGWRLNPGRWPVAGGPSGNCTDPLRSHDKKARSYG